MRTPFGDAKRTSGDVFDILTATPFGTPNVCKQDRNRFVSGECLLAHPTTAGGNPQIQNSSIESAE